MSSADADVGAVRHGKAVAVGQVPGWLWLGIGVYALLLINGNQLLNDSDTYWHIAVGRWILSHGGFPDVDIYSFTKAGEPWISTSWLAQILLARAYDLAGWSGPVILAAAAAAITFAQLAFILGSRIPRAYALVVAIAALTLTAPHLLARPHVLTLPVMVAWVHGLLQASERREPPSFWLLILMALWANLHGGFVFGLALIAPLGLDAWWNAQPVQRGQLALRWIVFGAAALVAACITPYGWESILASRKILELGELLNVIDEWKPANFARFGPFEAVLFAAIVGALQFGVRLSPPRIVLVLGLLHMALSHVRNVEMFALLTPLVVLAPLASQFALQPARPAKMSLPLVSGVAFIAILSLSTCALAAKARFSPPALLSQAAAVEVLKEHDSKHILNDLSFSGYLISREIPVFIDGRAELYGEQFALGYHRALQLANVNLFLDLLKTYDIDAVLLTPETPAVSLLDHVGGWRRIYSDENAVVYIRAAN